MRLTDLEIAGIPMKKLRSFFRRTGDTTVTAVMIADAFDLTRERAEALLASLVAAGLLEPSEVRDDWFEPTAQAARFVLTDPRNPLTRERAEGVVQDVLTRVSEVAEDPNFTHEVTRLVVFGDYLDPALDVLGSVDFGYEIDYKDRYRSLKAADAEDHKLSGSMGKPFRSLDDFIWEPTNRVVRHLKGQTGQQVRLVPLHEVTYRRVPIQDLYRLE